MAREHSAQLIKRRGAIAVIVAVVLLAVVFAVNQPTDESWTNPAPVPEPVAPHERGGSVRVAVPSPPEMADTGAGGNTLRQLTLPKMFDAQPDGTWRASLVVPGTDTTADDGKSARFKLRDATWSDGSRVGIEDLGRTADSRFVTRIQGPNSDGYYTADFTQKLPGWRRLWSGADSVLPPSPGLTSGPFAVQSVTSGLETVLVRNDNWYGAADGNGPFLDEIRLVVVPDAVMASQLLEASLLDVVAAPADSARAAKLSRNENLVVSVDDRSGSYGAIRIDPGIDLQTRRSIAAAIPRKELVSVFLKDEAAVLDGFGEPVWSAGAAAGDAKLDTKKFRFDLPVEEPLSSVIGKSVTQVVGSRGGSVNTKTVSDGDIGRMVRDGGYELLLETGQTGPEICWQCLFRGVDQDIAEKADAGDQKAAKKLQEEAREEGTFLPLWQSRAVVASQKNAVSGVVANGYDSGMAWGAQRWWRP